LMITFCKFNVYIKLKCIIVDFLFFMFIFCWSILILYLHQIQIICCWKLKCENSCLILILGVFLSTKLLFFGCIQGRQHVFCVCVLSVLLVQHCYSGFFWMRRLWEHTLCLLFYL
jgi:hypothetical protein